MAQKWIATSQKEVAEFFGQPLETVKDWRSKHMPGAARRWDLAVIVRWLRTEGPWRPKLRAEVPEVPEELTGPPTASLERLRLVRCKREELALRRELNEVMQRADVHEFLGRMGSFIRRATEVLQRRIGPEANDVMTELIDEFEKETAIWCRQREAFYDQWRDDAPSDLVPGDAGPFQTEEKHREIEETKVGGGTHPPGDAAGTRTSAAAGGADEPAHRGTARQIDANVSGGAPAKEPGEA